MKRSPLLSLGSNKDPIRGFKKQPQTLDYDFIRKSLLENRKNYRNIINFLLEIGCFLGGKNSKLKSSWNLIKNILLFFELFKINYNVK